MLRHWGTGLLVIAGLFLTACTEKPQDYTPGKSTAAYDPSSYVSAPFAGDRQAWLEAVNTRTKKQSEYVRVQ